MKILVTGSAGFIGFHVVKKLIEKGYEIIGLDNINDYYDIGLKYARLSQLGLEEDKIIYNKLINNNIHSYYRFIKLNLEDTENILRLFKTEKFQIVIHLAAQAGVRFSLENPGKYISSNIEGFMNIIEGCRYYNINHLIYASSSSVYGLNEKFPFSTHDNVDHPISLYAASKKANELIAHSYSHLFNIPSTGLRFFTVYGPWGRPDMALFHFTKSILENNPINIFNNGLMERDFTYIDDIVNGILLIMEKPATPNKSWNGLKPDPDSSIAPYKIYNIGKGNPVKLMDFIEAIEKELGIVAIKNFLPLQPGDVIKTWADTTELIKDFNYQPKTDIQEGVKQFIRWYLSYYNLKQ